MDLQSKENVDTFCNHILPRTCSLGILGCGSFYEQPLEYAMLNLSDLDHMFCHRTLIAATELTVIPKNFYGEVLTIETTNCHLGFAHLLRCREGKTEYYIRKRKAIQRTAFTKRLVAWSEVSNLFSAVSEYKPNFKAFTEYMIDYVYAISCPCWPSEAAEWRTRQRCRGWPTRDTIDQIVNGGCHLVAKSHESNSSDDTCWRFSFSKAELILLSTWNEVQKYVYHIIRLLKSDIVKKCGGKKNTFLCTYFFKTLMLWACEEKPPDFWTEDRIEAAIEELLLQMIQWVIEKNCPNYFMRENNMLDFLQGDFDVSNEVLLVHAALQVIHRVVAKEPIAYRSTMIHLQFSDKAILLGQLKINRRFIVDLLDQKRERFIVNNLSSSALFRNEVEHLFRAVELHRLLMSNLSSGEDNFSERKKPYETDALRYFQISCKRKGANRYLDAYFSLFDSLSTSIHRFLHEMPNERRQREWRFRRTDKSNLAKEAIEAICQSIISAADVNHQNASYFISAAYYANFQYTGLRDYRKALKICEETLAAFRYLANVFSMNILEPTFSNEILCVFVNGQYIDMFDARIQCVWGFLTLCVAIGGRIKQNEMQASVRSLPERDFVLQIFPLEFLEYIRIRCRNKLHLGELDRLEAMKVFHIINKERDTGVRKMSNAALSAAVSVDYNYRSLL